MFCRNIFFQRYFNTPRLHLRWFVSYRKQMATQNISCTAAVLLFRLAFVRLPTEAYTSTLKSCGKEKKEKRKKKLRDVVAQGPSKSRRIKNVYGYFFPRTTLMLRQTARKTGAFPEQANCNGVIVMSQRKVGKGCL